MKLNEIRAAEGSTKRAKRVGRGTASGHGKTSTRGHKGMLSRSGSGGLRPGFEGGQMTLARRLPKRGFTNIFKKDFQIVNIGDLKIFKENEQVTPAELLSNGLIRKGAKPVKILGSGDIQKQLIIKAHAFSKSAKDAIEKAGGKTELIKA